MSQLWFAQLFLLPVQVGWTALYWWVGRERPRRILDCSAIAIASLVWLAAVFWGESVIAHHGTMWAIILSTTAGFLGFNFVLAAAAIIRHRR